MNSRGDGVTPVTDSTTGELIAAVVDNQPDAVAFTEVHPVPEILPAGKGDDELTYAELDSTSNRIANALRDLGVGKGDVVSCQLPNWVEFPLVYLATNKLGAVAQPILPEHRAHEIEHIVGLCETDVLVVPATLRGFDYVDLLVELVADGRVSLDHVVVVGSEEAPPNSIEETEFHAFESLLDFDDEPVADYPDRDDLAHLIFTSGTTGEPKGVRQTEAIGMEQALALESEVLAVEPSDVIFAPAPLGHNTGFHYCMRLPMLKGATAVLFDRWHPERALETLADERCTIGRGATPFLKDILDVPGSEDYSLPDLRAFVVGGTSLPAPVVRRAYETFENLSIMAAWGQTENGIVTATRPDDDPSRVTETDGRVLPHCEVVVRREEDGEDVVGEPGELLMRGTSLFDGYHRRPELTSEAFTDDGWFRTGDVAVLAEDGYVTIVGRKKDIVIRGGENISALEVEEALLDHPDVLQVAVVAMPDERLQERPCAYVVSRDGTDLTVEDLSAFLESKGFRRQKHPERVECVSELPRTSSGKVQKFKLREDVAEKLGMDPAH